ncbi:MAG TPA: MarR family transcriptional regulator [Rubrobacter sp.]|nr:MarR family transcriptional regulator [Rubrobacter sp.]
MRKLSRGSSENGREELLGELVGEVRRLNGLGASFLRAVAGRVGMNATDLQVVDILGSAGPITAGRIAELTGLTTGATAQMLGRLERDGIVRRERDPDDGRRVLVRLAAGWDAMEKIGPTFDSAGRAWEELASRYDQGQLALILGFLQRANSVYEEEIYRLREAPPEGRDFSAPLQGVESGRLVFSSSASRIVLRADARMDELYRASFEGPVPEVKAEGGTVTFRYPRRLRLFDRSKQGAEVALNVAVPWRIEIRGGASEVVAELGGLDLSGLEVRGGASSFRVELPEPNGTVPVRIAGGASEIVVRRPPHVAARVRLKGWASQLTFDDQTFGAVGSDVRLQSPGYEDAAGRYDVEVSGSASDFTLTTTPG